MTSGTQAGPRAGQEVAGADEVEAAMKRAMKLLAVRSRSCRELTGRLLKAGFGESTAEMVVLRLSDVGLLNDEAFAAEVVCRGVATGRSARLTRQDLVKYGVAGEVADESLAELEEAGADEERALDLAERKAGSCRNLPVEKALQRVVRHLCSKGYAPGLAWEVARRAFREREIDID